MMRMMKMKILMWRMGTKTRREMKKLTVEIILQSCGPVALWREQTRAATSEGLL
jgi:hypothetical protein